MGDNKKVFIKLNKEKPKDTSISKVLQRLERVKVPKKDRKLTERAELGTEEEQKLNTHYWYTAKNGDCWGKMDPNLTICGFGFKNQCQAATYKQKVKAAIRSVLRKWWLKAVLNVTYTGMATHFKFERITEGNNKWKIV